MNLPGGPVSWKEEEEKTFVSVKWKKIDKFMQWKNNFSFIMLVKFCVMLVKIHLKQLLNVICRLARFQSCDQQYLVEIFRNFFMEINFFAKYFKVKRWSAYHIWDIICELRVCYSLQDANFNNYLFSLFYLKAQIENQIIQILVELLLN